MFREEVLGETVSVKFDDGKVHTGWIRECVLRLAKNSSDPEVSAQAISCPCLLEAQHMVVFDFGDEYWMDLTKLTLAGSLTWRAAEEKDEEAVVAEVVVGSPDGKAEKAKNTRKKKNAKRKADSTATAAIPASPPPEASTSTGAAAETSSEGPSSSKKPKKAKAEGTTRKPPKLLFEGTPDDELVGGWPEGWTKQVVERMGGNSAGTKDSYWIGPDKKKYRTMKAISEALGREWVPKRKGRRKKEEDGAEDGDKKPKKKKKSKKEADGEKDAGGAENSDGAAEKDLPEPPARDD